MDFHGRNIDVYTQRINVICARYRHDPCMSDYQQAGYLALFVVLDEEDRFGLEYSFNFVMRRVKAAISQEYYFFQTRTNRRESELTDAVDKHVNENDDLTECLNAALDTLMLTERFIIEKHFFEQMTNREIAIELGYSESYVTLIQQAAYRKLRTMISSMTGSEKIEKILV